MKDKILFSLFGLIIFFFVILAFSEIKKGKETNEVGLQDIKPTTIAQAQEIPNIKKADKVEVVNFHATYRCYSCQKLGKLSEKTIKERFTKEVNEGKVVFKSVNGDLPENREMVILYQATGSSLYINAIKDGKNHIVQNIKVWQYLNDEEGFKNYLEEKIRQLL